MHSRRPPSLRHKGNRRELQQKRKQQLEKGDAEQNPIVTPNVNGTRKKRKTGPCSPRTLLLIFILLCLGLYAKFVMSSASVIGKGMHTQKEGSVRGGIKNKDITSNDPKVTVTTVKQEGEPAMHTNTIHNTKGDAQKRIAEENTKSDAKKEAEHEEKEWKDLVKEQTTKEEQKQEDNGV
jgi:hypothetical protein